MIDPHNITNFNRTDEELEEFWLFCIMVAGKSSAQTANKLHKMISGIRGNLFNYLAVNDIRNFLVAHKVGQYNRITKAIEQSIGMNLRRATLDELMGIYGIGPKTARFFILHSRKDARIAVLDTHILKWLKTKGIDNVPDSTPDAKKYNELEKIFLAICEKEFPGKTIAEVDLAIWSESVGSVE